MFKLARWLVMVLFLLALFSTAPAAAKRPQPTPTPPPEPPLVLPANWEVPTTLPSNCSLGTDINGSETLICSPNVGWALNQTVIVYAHGYVNPYFPAQKIPWDQLSTGGVFLPTLVTDMGYYFATTSYRANGLVVQDAIQDLLIVSDMAKSTMKSLWLKTVVLAGVSEGGLITALSMERYPGSYYAGLSMCGPIGDFQMQINYWGDFRTLYDVYYAGSLPPDAITIPNSLVEAWYYDTDGYKTTRIAAALADSTRTLELLDNARAPYNPALYDATDPTTLQQGMASTLLGLLDYNIYATENGKLVLGGNPFDNRATDYPFSTLFNKDLDKLVTRYAASRTALRSIAKYQTTGTLTKPMVVMHTTGDPIVPFAHVDLYQARVAANGYTGNFSRYDVSRYGHCNFTQAEIMAAFDLLNSQATGLTVVSHESLLPENQRADYLRMLQEAGALK